MSLPEEKYDEIFKRVEPFTMTSFERVRALIESIEYVVANKLPGSIVECGAWKGGSMMAAALALLELDEKNRSVYLYDTFAGMPSPDWHDVSFQGDSAEQIHHEYEKSGRAWCRASADEVRGNLRMSGYPEANIHFIQGMVEETLMQTVPDQIAVLRLDTDWYQSTLVELRVLFPRLCVGGILILDDYGHWRGARKAVEQFFSEGDIRPFLFRIDYTGRLLIKQPPTIR